MSENKTPDEQLRVLKGFVRWAIKETAWLGNDLEGIAVQDRALMLGIIEQRTAAKSNFQEWMNIDDISIGDTFYVFADWVKNIPAEQSAPPSPWLPIETAPKDGSSILLGAPNCEPKMASWETKPFWLDGWYCGGSRSAAYAFSFEPTHWMPIPPLPEENKE